MAPGECRLQNISALHLNIGDRVSTKQLFVILLQKLCDDTTTRWLRPRMGNLRGLMAPTMIQGECLYNSQCPLKMNKTVKVSIQFECKRLDKKQHFDSFQKLRF